MRPLSHCSALLMCLLATLALVGCGSGGGGGPAPAPAPTDLGLLSSTQPTVVAMSFTNPLGTEATVTNGGSTGNFTIEPGALPDTVAAGAAHDVDVRFSPTSAGLVFGSITLRYEGAGQTQVVTHQLQATAETVIWSVAGQPIDFGLVEVGASVQRNVTIRNASSLSPVTLGSTVQSSSPAYSVVGTTFPLQVAPGDQAVLTLRFAPTVGGNHDGVVDVGAGSLGGPVRIQVRGEAPGESFETVVDFGLQNFSGNITSRLDVDVPADAISLTVEGYDAAGGSVLGLGELVGPNNKVYENLALTGAYIWTEGAEVFSTTVPNTDRTNVQLVPGGGTYSFRIRRMAGSASQVAVRAIIERRSSGQENVGTLDLNVWLADGLTPQASTAANDSRLQNILARIDTILAAQGIRVGDVDYYDVTNPAFDAVTSNGEFNQLLRTTSAAADVRLNLFFVEVALGGNVVGAAATISGPARNGTSLSGVMSIYDGGLSANVIGMIAAHEIGHFCGLYHTVEQTGSHDFIDDTLECPANGTNGTCTSPGGGYLMHWQAVGGSTLTNGQGLVVRAHPLLRASAGGVAKFLPVPLDDIDLIQAQSLPPGWCGCPGCHAKHPLDASR